MEQIKTIYDDMEWFLDNLEIKGQIIDTMIKTKNTGFEHAFHFAIVDEDVVMSKIIEGEASGVDLEDEVDFREFIVFEKHGDFHTHPYRTTSQVKGIFPSDMDIYYWLLNRSYFSCIGELSDGKILTIRCFPVEIIRESIKDIKEYLKSINEPNEFFDATQELRASMIYAPEGWKEHLFTKVYDINI